MSKAITTISIDPIVLQAIQAKYPGKVSSIVEDFFRTLLDQNDLEDEFKSKELLLKELTDLEAESIQTKSKIELVRKNLREIKDSEQQRLSNDFEENKNKYFNLNSTTRKKFMLIFDTLNDHNSLPDGVLTPVAYYNHIQINYDYEKIRLRDVFGVGFLSDNFYDKVLDCEVFEK